MRKKTEPLPDFDTYTIDFNSDNRPECFHLFWKDKEVATIRLFYNSDGFLSKAVREGTRPQKRISIKDLMNLPFFTAYIHRINLIDLITEITTIGNIDWIQCIDWIAPEEIDGETYNTVIGAVKLIKEISNIENVESIDLIDKITEITEVKDIKTIGANNIIIDLLKQNAYTERRETLSNNGASASLQDANLTTMRGKFFPRGCRGFLKTIEIYCANYNATQKTLTVYVAPFIGFGKLIEKTLTIPVYGSEQWRSVSVAQQWNYDSMFIWVKANDDVQVWVGYDTSTPYDNADSTDGSSWTVATRRYWFRVNMTAMTLGDLPVSGTINTVEVPSVASQFESDAVSVPNNEITSILSVEGAGTTYDITLIMGTNVTPSSTIQYALYVYCDGEEAYNINNRQITFSLTATSGRGIEGKFYQLAGDTILVLYVPLKFRRKIEVKCVQQSGGAIDVYGRIYANLQK
jgi:hypothetical protein